MCPVLLLGASSQAHPLRHFRVGPSVSSGCGPACFRCDNTFGVACSAPASGTCRPLEIARFFPSSSPLPGISLIEVFRWARFRCACFSRCTEAVCVTLRSSGPWCPVWSCVDIMCWSYFLFVRRFVCEESKTEVLCCNCLFEHFVPKLPEISRGRALHWWSIKMEHRVSPLHVYAHSSCVLCACSVAGESAILSPVFPCWARVHDQWILGESRECQRNFSSRESPRGMSPAPPLLSLGWRRRAAAPLRRRAAEPPRRHSYNPL